MSSYDYIYLRYQELKALKTSLTQLLAKAPAGTLLVSLAGPNPVYKYVIGHQKPVYIRKKDRVTAMKLASKAVRKKMLYDTEKELAAIEAYLKIFNGESAAEEFLLSHDQHRKLAEEWGAVKGDSGTALLSDALWLDKVRKNPIAYDLLLRQVYRDTDKTIIWKYEPDMPTADKQEERTVKTLCGVMVRSKSEAIYANELYNAGQLFIYEPELNINGRICHPDFVVFHPRTGELIILEHLGLLQDFEEIENPDPHDPMARIKTRYRLNNAEKVKNYIQAGYLPGRNLILMSETSGKPLDTMQCHKMIETIFSS